MLSLTVLAKGTYHCRTVVIHVAVLVATIAHRLLRTFVCGVLS